MNNYPNLITFDGKRLPQLKKFALKSGPLQSKFRKWAEELLDTPRMSVVDRKLKAISGNVHDYMSMGPYWWPNPDTDDALPYVRRDGEVNPETKDSVTYQEMVLRIFDLSLAAYYYDDDRFSKKAVKMVRDWHIDEKTYMTPHLEYGQAIPGYCTGRAIGLIDTKYSYLLFNAIRILEFIGAIDGQTVSKIKEWYCEFVNWMLTSEKGIDEDNQPNNHGSWYDVQVASAAVFCDRPMLLKRTLQSAYERRVVKQISTDGAQPHELSRTHAISYSSMNLNALFLLGNMARLHGVDAPYWDKLDGGKCLLARAVDYFIHSCTHFDEFRYQEISGKPKSDDAVMFASVINEIFPEYDYSEFIKSEIDDSMMWRMRPIV